MAKRKPITGPPWRNFDHWFTAQFGPAPQSTTPFLLRSKVADARYALALAERNLREREEWETLRRGALSAWATVRDGHKRR